MSGDPTWIMGGAISPSGALVTEETLRGISAFYAVTKVLYEDLAALPRDVFERWNGSRHEVNNHPVAWLVNAEPNPVMTAYAFWCAVAYHVLVVGNAYVWIEFDRASRIKFLWLLRPDRVRVQIRDGQKRYTVWTEAGKEESFEDYEMLHFFGVGYDGCKGYSVIDDMLGIGGVALSQQRFVEGFYANGAHPSGVLTHPKSMGDTAWEKWKKRLKDRQVGARNAGNALILEEGMQWQQIGVDPDKAQQIESREFQVLEFCRYHRMPPHKVQHLKEATFSNIEHQGIEYSTGTLTPKCVMIEQELNRKLFSGAQLGRFYVKHNLRALVRGDMKTRNEAYAIGRQWGWLSPNAILALEDMPPLPGAVGDSVLSPLNMLMLAPDSAIPVQNPTAKPTPAGGDGRTLVAFRGLFRDAAARCMRREFKGISSIRPDTAQEFESRVTRFLEEHRSYIASAFRPAVESFVACLGGSDSVLDGVVDSYLERTKSDLANVLTQPTPVLGAKTWEARAESVGDAALELVFRAVKRAQFGVEAA